MRRTLFLICFFILISVVTIGCVDSSNPTPKIAFVHVNLIPMMAEAIVPDQTVLIEGDRIVLIGNSSSITIPSDAQIIDATGGYLLPGLADMHVHIYEESRDQYPVSPFNLYIANGVTTIRDCGSAPLSARDTFVLDWRDEILRGEIAGPMIYSSGRTIHGPVTDPSGVIRERYEHGFDFAKLYMELSVDEFSQAQSTAEELNLYTVGHIPYQVGIEKAISAGLDEIAHLEELTFEFMWSDKRPDHILSMQQWLDSIIQAALELYGDETGLDMVFNPDKFTQIRGQYLHQVLDKLISNQIVVGTTLATYEVVDQKLFDKNAFLAREVNLYLPDELIVEIMNEQNRHQLMYQALGDRQDAWIWKRDLDTYILKQLHQAGVVLVSGTDAGSSSIGVVEGFATHDDLRLLTENGFTPYEALQTATVNAAYVVERMTGKNDFGTIQIGKRADLVLISANPLVDINNTREILGVMVRGQWYPKEELEKMITIDN